MGTRGFVGFVVNETEKIAYNHHDSYPEHLGLGILNWLRACDHTEAARLAAELRVVQQSDETTAEDVERLAPWTDRSVGSGSSDSWYRLLRRAQGNPAEMLRAGVLEDASEFPADSLFAEWGYVVDFDTRRFEVYRGFQTARHSEGRFAGRTGRDGYQPVRLMASWPLGELPGGAAFQRALLGPGDDW